jgi:hypothetical protein
MSDVEDEIVQTGRPEFIATAELRASVERGVSCGMTQRELAAALDCDEKTLRKHFEEELFAGRSKRRLHNLDLLFKSAEEGNVSAQKYIEQVIAMSGDIGGQSTREPQHSFIPKEERPGKKELQLAAAQEPPPEGSKWSGLLN